MAVIPRTHHASNPAAIIAAKRIPSDTSVPGVIVRHMSLFHPPAWFPPQLAFLWPLIWVQVLMLRAHSNDRLTVACDGRAAVPAYLNLQPLSLWRGGMRG